MPLSVDPDDTVDASLLLDESKPAESRPTFKLRFLTARKRSAVARLIDEAGELHTQGNRGGAIEKLNEAIAIGVASWRNMPEGFQPNDDHLTDDELGELAVLVMRKPRLAEDERRFFARQSAATGENSANNASDENAKEKENLPPAGPIA